jgi:hypothetical protein
MITYADKETNQISPVEEKFKVTAPNMNEIKQVVNRNEESLNQLGTLYNQHITNDQHLSNNERDAVNAIPVSINSSNRLLAASDAQQFMLRSDFVTSGSQGAVDKARLLDDEAGHSVTPEEIVNHISSNVLTAVNQGNGVGYVMEGRDENNYGNVGLRATDLSFNAIPSQQKGATGQSSLAAGDGVIASGLCSVGFGRDSAALANYAFVVGKNTIARYESSVALGAYNKALAGSTILEIGIGTQLNQVRANGLEVHGVWPTNQSKADNWGAVVAPEMTNQIIDDYPTDRVLITKEYADANYSGDGGGGTIPDPVSISLTPQQIRGEALIDLSDIDFSKPIKVIAEWLLSNTNVQDVYHVVLMIGSSIKEFNCIPAGSSLTGATAGDLQQSIDFMFPPDTAGASGAMLFGVNESGTNYVDSITIYQ